MFQYLLFIIMHSVQVKNKYVVWNMFLLRIFKNHSSNFKGGWNTSGHFFLVYCLDATDLKLSQLIWPAARGRCYDETKKLAQLEAKVFNPLDVFH